jgi:hypothetical protein
MLYISSNNVRHPVTKTFTALHYTSPNYASLHYTSPLHPSRLHYNVRYTEDTVKKFSKMQFKTQARVPVFLARFRKCITNVMYLSLTL